MFIVSLIEAYENTECLYIIKKYGSAYPEMSFEQFNGSPNNFILHNEGTFSFELLPLRLTHYLNFK